MNEKTRVARGLSEIGAGYDLFVLDQFGVLHDGQRAYPHAIAALEALASAGKQVAIVSNSGKRSAVNEARMARLGFDRALYHSLVTSGEVAWQMLARRSRSSARPGRQRCFLVTSNQDHSPVDGLEIDLTDEPGEADVVLIAGAEGHAYPEDHYRACLAPAAARGTPCLCTNPDKLALTIGGRCYGPGRVAEIYAELGGAVRWIGKPFPEIYRFTLSKFEDVAASRTVCVGDSIEHDIAGARGAGLSSVLVTGGILADQSPAELDALAARHRAPPDYIMAQLAP